MRKIVQRYVAFNFLPPFIISCIFFVTFLLTFQLFRIIKIVINKSAELAVVFELMGHIAVSFLPLAIPLSALIATFYSLNKLSEDSEIVAMRSFGFSKLELLKPLMLLGSLIALVVFALNANLIPFSKMKFKHQIIKLTSKGMLTDISSGKFFTEIPNIILFADKVENKGQVLKNVFIHINDRDGITRKVIAAQEGHLLKMQDTESSSDISMAGLRLHLMSGNIVKTSRVGSSVEKILFKDYDFPLYSVDKEPDFVTKDGMKTSGELFRILFGKDRSTGDTSDLREVKIEFWSRINTPLQCLLFVFLAFCLGIKRERGKSKNGGGLILLLLIGYYVLFFTGLSFAQKGIMNPFVAVFLPTALIGIIVYYFYRRLDWVD